MTAYNRGDVLPAVHFSNLRPAVHDFLVGRVDPVGEPELFYQPSGSNVGQVVFLADTDASPSQLYVTPEGIDQYRVVEYVNVSTPMMMYFDQDFRNKVEEKQVFWVPVNYVLGDKTYTHVYFAKGPSYVASDHFSVYLTERNETYPHTLRFWDAPVLDAGYVNVVDGYQNHVDVKFWENMPVWYDDAVNTVMGVPSTPTPTPDPDPNPTPVPEPCTIEQHLNEIADLDQQLNDKQMEIDALLSQLDMDLNSNYQDPAVQTGESNCDWMYHRLVQLKTDKLNLMIEKEGQFRQCHNDVVNQMDQYNNDHNQLVSQIDQINQYEQQYVNGLEELRQHADEKIAETHNHLAENSNQMFVVDQYKNYLNQLDALYLADLDRLNQILNDNNDTPQP